MPASIAVQSPDESQSFSRRNVKGLFIRIESGDNWDDVSPAVDSAVPDAGQYNSHSAYVLRMNDLEVPNRKIYVNVYRSSDIPESHIVSGEYDSGNDGSPRGDIVHNVLLSTKDTYQMKVDSIFKAEMIEAITRYLDMEFPCIHLDCEVVTILSARDGVAGNATADFSRSLPLIDISLLLY